MSLLILIGTTNAQNVIVCDWEIIDFPQNDARKITEMLRQELSQKCRVISHAEMARKTKEANIVIPPHLELDDFERLAELFQAPYLITGLITKVEEQFIVNVRLIKIPPADTIASITRNIAGTLLEPSETFVPEIAVQLQKNLPVTRDSRSKKWLSYKLIGAGALVSGVIIGYLFWPRDEESDPEKPVLPRPPKFPH